MSYNQLFNSQGVYYYQLRTKQSRLINLLKVDIEKNDLDKDFGIPIVIFKT